MMMWVFKQLKWTKLAWVLVCVLSSITISANAHVLTETSAQVILRDGQIEIKILTDIEHLIAALQSEQAWLLGDIDTVMPQNLSPSQQQEFITNALKQKMHLRVNNKVINVEPVLFARESNDPEQNMAHGKEIVFQARHSFAQVNDLTISFHKSLGPVHASIVKPQYKLLNTGDIGHFEL
jgi:hypothetical protein